jgi:hypothetical protein
MSKSPDGKGMMESFSNWDFNYYYIDAKATPERDALKARQDDPGSQRLAQGRGPHHSLTRTINGKEHKISLGEYGEFTGHLIEGGMGGAVQSRTRPERIAAQGICAGPGDQHRLQRCGPSMEV